MSSNTISVFICVHLWFKKKCIDIESIWFIASFPARLMTWVSRSWAHIFVWLLLAFGAPSFANQGAHVAHDSSVAPYIVYDQAEFLQSASLNVPDAASEWIVVDLPDSWRKQKRDWAKYGWYRLTFTHHGAKHDGHAASQRAVYISRVTNNIELYLNGSSFALSGRLGPKPQESWNLAQYHLVPSSLIREGENTLLIRLHPDKYARAGVANVLLGDADALKSIYDTRYFIQTTAPQLITGVLVVMAIFSLTLWLRRRSETMFLLFGLMAVVAVVRLFHHYLRDTPDWLGAMAVPAMCWLSILQVNFSLHYADKQMPRFERALIIFGVFCSVFILICALTGYFWLATTVIYSVFALMAPFLTGLLIYQLTRNLTRGNILMIVAVLFNAAVGVHDFINYQELLGFDRLYLLPLGLPLLLMSVAALLVKRFVETLDSYESLNADLANRITIRERDLAASFLRERVLDQQRATAEERQRLMRDMHDGLGSQLMSTLAVMRRGTLTQAQLETIIADAIDELKLTIDSLEPVERDLLVVLGNLRYRLEPRLQAAGITLEWAVTDLPPLDYLDPSNVRSVLHIVQEAFTNTLKHANATRITLSTGVDRAAGRVLVRMTDDGQSFDHDKIRNGRGLANMRDRAARLGGHVEIIPLKGGGTCVSLYLPLAVKSGAA
jgi:signal transduction histidine kinase